MLPPRDTVAGLGCTIRLSRVSDPCPVASSRGVWSAGADGREAAPLGHLAALLRHMRSASNPVACFAPQPEQAAVRSAA